MKKAIIALMSVLMLVSMVGCKGLDPLVGTASDGATTLIAKSINYKDAGERIGELIYYGYCLMKEDPKNADKVADIENIWRRMESSNDKPSMAVLSELGLDLAEEAMAKKYTPLEARMIRTGIESALRVLQNITAEKVDTENVNEFMDGVVTGIKTGQAKYTPVVRPIEPKEEIKPVTEEEIASATTNDVFTCASGNCYLTKISANPTIEYQLAVAEKLLAEYPPIDEKLLLDLKAYRKHAKRLKAEGGAIMDILIEEFKIEPVTVKAEDGTTTTKSAATSIVFIEKTNQKSLAEQIADVQALLADPNIDEISKARNQKFLAELLIMQEQGVDPTYGVITCINNCVEELGPND